MKSVIDWNELVPRLPKKVRDDLYLEAVAILSQQDDEARPRKARRKAVKLPQDYKRKWSDEGIPGSLAAPGRKFRVIKDSKVATNPESKMGKVILALRKLANDIITVEGINSVAKGAGISERPQEAVEYLWARRLLEVVNDNSKA